MKKTIHYLLAIGIVLLSFSSAWAHQPAIYHVLLDATGSISREDFQQANEEVIQLVDALYTRAQDNPGELSDWLAVNYFGGVGEYSGNDFINCSRSGQVEDLVASLGNKKHPRYNYTAIYDALARATADVANLNLRLDEAYMNTIILVTDGQDNRSTQELKRRIRQVFPNSAINLYVIAVGPNCNTKELEGMADMIIPIKDFSALGAALLLTTDLL